MSLIAGRWQQKIDKTQQLYDRLMRKAKKIVCQHCECLTTEAILNVDCVFTYDGKELMLFVITVISIFVEQHYAVGNHPFRSLTPYL
jgi:hypothetical protein